MTTSRLRLSEGHILMQYSAWNGIWRPVMTLLALLGIFIASANAQEPATPPSPNWQWDAISSYETAIEQIISTLNDAADNGDGAAALALARFHLASDSIDVQQEGVAYAERAADLGAADAYQLVAAIFTEGRHGLIPNVVKATSALEKAATASRSEELYALGSRLVNNNSGAQDTDRGVDLLTQAAQAGSINASSMLASLYLSGRRVTGNLGAALYYYSLGAMGGNRSAIEGVGDVFRKGSPELPAKPLVALAHYQEAARLGSRGAAREIADMYLTDELGEPDIARAETMLLELATGGDANAYVDLGDIYSRGEVTTPDLRKAAEFYQTAGEMGNATGFNRLANLAQSNSAVAGLSSRALIESLEQSSALGDNSARRRLATMYLEGTQVAPNPQRALELLNESAAAGDASAAEQLALIHADNIPLPADFEAVERYLALATSLGRRQAVIAVAAAVAQGPLGRTHANDALEWLTEAVEAEEPGAAAQLATLQLEGRFPGSSIRGVISMLNEAAQGGDVDAAKYLLKLYREGYGLLLPPDTRAANAFLEQIAPVLGEEETIVERITLLANGSPSPGMFEQIGTQFDGLSPSKAGSILRRLRSLNDRAYVYVIQKNLAQLGLYSGALHGTLDASTIRAIQLACAQVGASRECAMGPLSFEASRVLSGLIWPQ